MKKNIYSVGQVNKYIKDMFAQDFMLHHINIRGEVSNCKYHSSGHIYFTIKDEKGAMSAIMFAGNRGGLKFPMKDGDSVVVTGSVEVYERDGKYQIYAREIELDGAGDLYVRFEELKQRLEEMGMFADEYKQPIPRFARTVGVVTAPTGAAVQDIKNIARRRNPAVQLILCPAIVQGADAPASIISGISRLEQLDVDVMIIGRGGGSIEDLWAFNDEDVARAIFNCSVPIISAVGHQTDFTIADFVADLRAPTPSAAAELAVCDREETARQLAAYRRSMDVKMRGELDRARARYESQKMRLAMKSPQSRLNENRRRAIDFADALSSRMKDLIGSRRQRLSILSERLEGLSPAKRLAMGYAFVAGADGRAVTRADSVACGDEIAVRFADGAIRASVTAVELNEK